MTNDTLSLEATAEQVHAAMVWAATEGKGEPQPWQGGNSTAEDHARHIARKIEALRTPTPDTRALRQQIAQIVDPHCFVDDVPGTDSIVSQMVAQSREDAGRKADRILALLDTPKAPVTDASDLEWLASQAAEIDNDWAADRQEGGNAPKPDNPPERILTTLRAQPDSALAKYAREASKALTDMAGGGSEMFERIGDEFYADPALCRRRHLEKMERLAALRSHTPAPDGEEA